MTIRLYGSPITRAQRVMWMLRELGLPYEHVPSGVPSELGPLASPEEIRALNPSGKVPILVDGGEVLTESLAINLYLALHYESELTPRSHLGWGRAFQWTSWVLNDIDPNLTEVIVVRRAGMLAQLDEAQRKRDALLRFGLHRQLETLERACERASWLAEDRFTVADLNVAAVLALAEPSGVDLGGLPKLRTWLSACLARPAARSAWGQVIRDARAAGFVGNLKVPSGTRAS